MKSFKFINFNISNGLELIDSDLSKYAIPPDSILRIKYASISEHFLELLCKINSKIETLSITDIPETQLCQILEFKIY